MAPLLRSLVFALTALFCALQPAVADAAPSHLELQTTGRTFLGGKAPTMRRLDVVGEHVAKNGEVFYLYKALVQRSSGDRSGSLVLFKARTYGDAFAKLAGISPSSKRTFDMFFPKSIDKTHFKPVLLDYKYVIKTRSLDDGTRKMSAGPKRAKGKTRFVENLSMGLRPGTYEVKLEVSVELGEHFILDMWELSEWFDMIVDLQGFGVAKVKEVTEWFTLVGFTKNLAKTLLTNRLTSSQTVYELTVLAKVPSLRGRLPSQAVQALRDRKLKAEIKETTRCPGRTVNRVIAQSPKPNARLPRDGRVTVQICRDRLRPAPVPTPTPAPVAAANFGGKWICPGRGVLQLSQSGTKITGGSFSGDKQQDWRKPNNGSVGNGGVVKGRSAEFRFNAANNTYSKLKVTMSANGKTFDGSWDWFNNDDTPRMSGGWSCKR